MQAESCNFIKRETLAQAFSCEFCEITKNIFFYRIPPVAASVSVQSYQWINQNNVWNLKVNKKDPRPTLLLAFNKSLTLSYVSIVDSEEVNTGWDISITLNSYVAKSIHQPIKFYVHKYQLSHNSECNMTNVFLVSHILQFTSRAFRRVK